MATKKYKQTTIPKTKTTNWTGLKPLVTRKNIAAFYKENIAGKTVVNAHKGITVIFSKTGENKLAFGGRVYPKKAALVEVLTQMVKQGEFSNFGNAKEKDGDNVVGFLNFKCKVQIDDKIENVRFTVQMRNDGKFYYSHEVNIYKK
jgi:Large polyvalent protein-associated domain 3